MKRRHQFSTGSQLDTRGVSETVGVVLILGMVVMGTGALAVTGGDMISTLQNQAAQDQAENAFAKLSSSTTSVALGDTTTRTSVNLGLGIENDKSKTLGVKDAGVIRVYINNTTSGTETLLTEQDLGELRYTNKEGEKKATQIGLQNGGTWSGSEEDSTMSNPPEAHYEGETLTLPLVTIDGDENINSDEVQITKKETVFPTNHVGINQDEVVRLEIESRYYKAWAEYFQTHLPGQGDITLNHEQNSATVRLGFNNVFPKTFDSAVIGTGSISMNKGNPNINGDVATSGECNSCAGNVDGTIDENYEFDGSEMDSIVNSRVSSLRENGTHLTLNGSSPSDIDAGKYYSQELTTEDGDIVIDVSDGDVVLGLDGDAYIEEQVYVVGGDEEGSGEFIVYATGDYSVVTGGSGVFILDGADNTHNQVYGTSSMTFNVNQQGTFQGLLYAPDSSSTSGEGSSGNAKSGKGGNGKSGGNGPGSAACGDVSACIGQQSTVEGAVVTGSMQVGQGAEVTYTSEFEDFEPKMNLEEVFRPQIIYLHISVNKVTVEEA